MVQFCLLALEVSIIACTFVNCSSADSSVRFFDCQSLGCRLPSAWQMPKGFFSSAHFQFGGNIEMQHNGRSESVVDRGRTSPAMRLLIMMLRLVSAHLMRLSCNIVRFIRMRHPIAFSSIFTFPHNQIILYWRLSGRLCLL